MSTVLAVHASPRGDRSHSRRLAEVFLSAWQARHPQSKLTRREVGRALIPPVNEAFVAAAFYPRTRRTTAVDASGSGVQRRAGRRVARP